MFQTIGGDSRLSQISYDGNTVILSLLTLTGSDNGRRFLVLQVFSFTVIIRRLVIS